MATRSSDVVVVGGGIVGLATALALVERGAVVTVLEAEDRPGMHQSGHNSGVLHSGVYYEPGSHKAVLCAEGRRLMLGFCAENEVPYRLCGKLVMAVDEDEIPRLDELERRSRANGLEGLERLDRAGVLEHEPASAGVDGLLVPGTGVVDFAEVTRAMARRLADRGGTLRTGARVVEIRRQGSGLSLRTANGEHAAGWMINCAGLQCDRVAKMAGAELDVRIVPFRGEYFELLPEARSLVKALIYPVPDPAFPFLGVHLTRTLDGRVEAGPNAVLALRREGYERRDVSLRDVASTLCWPGFWIMARKAWRQGATELLRAASAQTFAAGAARLVPAIDHRHIRRAGAGVRAQAVDRKGRLLADFLFADSPRGLHVLNAPSPAATASLAIGRQIAERLSERMAG